MSLAAALLILGIIAVVANWIITVHVIESDEAVGKLISPTAHLDSTRQDALAEAHAN